MHSAMQCHITLDTQGHANTARRDELFRYQKEAQKRWQQDKLFEVDAPAEGQQFVLDALLAMTLVWADLRPWFAHLCVPSLAIQRNAAEKVTPCAIAPAGEVWDAGKFFGNFPYPYMNGMLHLGHAFSLSKVCNLPYASLWLCALQSPQIIQSEPTEILHTCIRF